MDRKQEELADFILKTTKPANGPVQRQAPAIQIQTLYLTVKVSGPEQVEQLAEKLRKLLGQ